jgi:hypothetical protein
MKGYITCRKGKKFTKEHCKNLSKSHIGLKFTNRKKGHHLSEEHRIKLSLAVKGYKHPNWKGGITPKDKFERAKFRRIIQKDVLRRDDYTCQMCGQRGGELQVDHIQSWKEYVELRFNINNCRTLCKSCHYKITFDKLIPDKNIHWGNNLKKVRISGGV